MTKVIFVAIITTIAILIFIAIFLLLLLIFPLVGKVGRGTLAGIRA